MISQSTFYKAVDDFLGRMMEHAPLLSTHLGEHRQNHRLADFSPEGISARRALARESLAVFQRTDTTGFDAEAVIDRDLMVQIAGSFVRRDELEREEERQPGAYLGEVLGGVGMLLLKEYAPLSERLEAALGRVREAPRVLAEARTNLRPDEVPPVWAETARQQARQSLALFRDLLPALAEQATPSLAPAFKEYGEDAAAALERFDGFLEREVLPVAAGDFAAGKDLFDAKLREEHMVDYDSEELLSTGRRLFIETRENMEALARKIDPERSVDDILEAAKADHPTADDLLREYRSAMTEIREYVIEHEIVTVPENEHLRVVETPAYLRPLIPYAAYMQPGMLEDRQDGVFLVTPVEPGSPPEDQEQKLKGHYSAKLPITALHEAYPGHHLQLVWANRHPRVPRRIGSILSTLFVEGWAFYCEQLLEDLGYISEPIQRLARLSDQLWRAARIIIDVSLHTRGMSVEEAVDFLVKECRLEPSNALVEVRRYTQSPTQPQSYLMGKLALVDLVADYRRANPDATLRQVHDAIMSCGSLPPKLMRRQLGV